MPARGKDMFVMIITYCLLSGLSEWKGDYTQYYAALRFAALAKYITVKIAPGEVIVGVRVPVTRSSHRRVNHALYCSERVPTSHHITLASHVHPV